MNSIKKYFANKLNIQKIFFGIYLYLVSEMTAFVVLVQNSTQDESFFIITVTILLIPLSFVLSICLFWIVSKLKINIKKKKTLESKLILFICLFIIFFVCFLIMYFLFYPGSYWTDSLIQYEWASNGWHNNWHPFMQTIFMFRIPFLIFGNFELLALPHIIFFAIALAFLIETIYEITNMAIAIISFCFIFFNPNTPFMAISMIKDSSFCIVCMIEFALIARFLICDVKKSQKIILCICFAIFNALILSFRHNGITISFILIILYYFIANKKMFKLVLMVVISLFLFFQVFLVRALYVFQRSVFTRLEIYSIPVLIFVDCYKNCPDNISIDVQDYFFDITENYNFDNINVDDLYKDSVNIITQLIYNNLPNINIFDLYLNAIKLILQAPKNALHSLFVTAGYPFYLSFSTFDSQMGWGIFTYDEKMREMYPINDKNIDSVKKAIEDYKDIFHNNTVFSRVGIYMLVLVLLLFSKCKLWTKEGRAKSLIILSLFSYVIATSAFLIWSEFRYFYFIILIFPLLLILMLYEDESIWSRK